MFKYGLFYLRLILIVLFLLPLYLKAADNVSSGKIIFEDDAVKTQNRLTKDKVDTPQSTKGQVVEKPDPIKLPTDAPQIDSIEEGIKPNFKKDRREADLDEVTMFKPNKEQNLYGINILALRINVKKDKSGKVIGLLPEGVNQPTSYINEKNSPDYYLNVEMNNYREKGYSATNLYESHKELLRSFVGRVPREQDAIILMYMNGSNLKNYSDREMQLEKTVYSQYVTDFLYRNKRKLIIEKRYVDDVPEDEIFLIISRYDGNIPPNIYNASKGNILQWLIRYKELERQEILDSNKAKNNLEKTLGTVTDAKNKALLSTFINREVKKDNPVIKIDESHLFQKEHNTSKRDTKDATYTGPRRVIEKKAEDEKVASTKNNKTDKKSETKGTDNKSNTTVPSTVDDSKTHIDTIIEKPKVLGGTKVIKSVN